MAADHVQHKEKPTGQRRACMAPRALLFPLVDVVLFLSAGKRAEGVVDFFLVETTHPRREQHVDLLLIAACCLLPAHDRGERTRSPSGHLIDCACQESAPCLASR